VNGVLQQNLLSPIALSFVLGVLAKAIKSEFHLPKDIYIGLSTYLLFAIGLHGGYELGHSTFSDITGPALVTLAVGCITPVSAWAVLRYLGRFPEADAAGIAAHYGSVSAVTFIAAQQYVQAVGAPAEGFMPTLLTLLESPGIHIALAIGALRTRSAGQSVKEVLHEIVTGRTMVLLVGGLLVGLLMGEKNWLSIQPVFDTKSALFKGLLCLFLLEMGVTAGSRLRDLRTVGPFLIAFGMLMPLLHGALGVALGVAGGLSVGGATVLGTMAASASYIAAPPAVRATLPAANPTLYLTSALAITFPFNLLVGIPAYFALASWLAG
jgi:uncharacterized protein